MPKIIFPSKWLKANDNVKHGDFIVFQDSGEFDEKNSQWIFNVEVERTGEVKKFGLNKKNFNAIKAVYGDNSDAWKDQKMRVIIMKVDSPQGIVDAVRLTAPDGKKTIDEVNEEGQEVNPDEVPF